MPFGMPTLRPTLSPLRSVAPARLAGTALAQMLALTSVSGQVVDLAYDGFDYTAGALTGRNGGTGWSTGWIRDYGSGATFNVNATGLESAIMDGANG